jgi:tetratricopeptide (TPR) repeat protein
MAYASLQDWDRAEADCTNAIQRNAHLPHVWRDKALMQLRRGDAEGYKTTCARMIDRFVQDGDFVTLGVLGLTCEAVALPTADLARVRDLAQIWVAREPQNPGWRHILGAMLYRAGRYEEALQRLNESRAAPGGGERADFWIALAMCHYQLGHLAEARQLLDKASQMIDTGRPLPYLLDLKYRPMLREAEALIKKRETK